MPEIWNFHCSLRERGDHAIESWRVRLTRKGRAKLDRALDHLKHQPKDEWSRPHASPLGDHIYVIRFKDENGTPWRLFGHFYDAHHSFVATLGGTERDGQYLPDDYGERCASAKLHCDGDFDARTHACLRGCRICSAAGISTVGGVLPSPTGSGSVPRLAGP